MYVCMYVCMYILVTLRENYIVEIHTSMQYVRTIYVFLSIYVCMYVCMYVCKYVCMWTRPFIGDERPPKLGLGISTCCCTSKFSMRNHTHIWYSFKNGKTAAGVVDSALCNALLLLLGTNNPDPMPPKSKYVDREALEMPLSWRIMIFKDCSNETDMSDRS